MVLGEARKGVENAREQIANLIKAKPEEIFFNSGGTEADNMAVIGAAMANKQRKTYNYHPNRTPRRFGFL